MLAGADTVQQQQQQQQPQQAVCAAAATSSAAAPAAAASGADDGEISDAVQRTCRGACALRAIELLRRGEQRALVADRLALALAGARQLEDYGARWDQWEAREGPGGHSYFAARAALLDAIVEEHAAALAGLGGSTAAAGAGSSVEGSGGSAAAAPAAAAAGAGDRNGAAADAAPSVQVVSLGCGVDTRPWRLSFPAGTHYVDVDQAPVLAFKTKALAAAGAGGLPVPTAACGGAGAAGSGTGGGGSDTCAGSGGAKEPPAGAAGAAVKFPLRCARYSQVVADLESPDLDLPALLAAAGLDGARPTLWVAEGLCYYLSAAANARLLRGAAACCTAARSSGGGGGGKGGGSASAAAVFVATHIPRCNLDANRACPASSPLARLFTVCVDDVTPVALSSEAALAAAKAAGGGGDGSGSNGGGDGKSSAGGAGSGDLVSNSSGSGGGGGAGACMFQAAGWARPRVSADIADLVAARFGGARCYYPYSLEYSGGAPLPSIEVVVEAELCAAAEAVQA